MFKRCFGLLSLFLLLGAGVASAQDGGSTLAAWADSPGSAFNVSTQVEWPSYQVTFGQMNTYSSNGETQASCTDHAYSMWHTFVPTQTGPLQIEVAGSNYDTFFAVYRTSPTPANEMVCSNPTSSIGFLDGTTINVRAGTRYYVMFAATSVGTGINSSSTMTVRYSSNSILDRGFVIPGTGVYSNVQDRIELASGAAYPAATCPDRNYSVYYKFRPTATGRYEVTTQGSNYDTVLALYDENAPALTNDSRLAAITICNDNINSENVASRIRPTLTAGTTYYFIVGQSLVSSAPMNDNMILSIRVRRM